MNKNDFNKITNNLIEIYKGQGFEDRIKRIIDKDIQTPFFSPIIFHDEEMTIKKEINMIPIEIFHDITLIDNIIKHSVVQYNNLLVRSKTKLLNIEKTLMDSYEKMNDMLLYNTENIITIKEEDCYGNFDYSNGCFFCKSIEKEETNIRVNSVEGNGYEGNEFAFDPIFKVLSSSLNKASTRENMFNDYYDSTYEYSRLTAASDEKNTFRLINKDNTMAKCILEIKSLEKISFLHIVINSEPVKLLKVEYSDNGLNYRDAFVEEKLIHLEDTVTFPKSNYIKLTLEATENTNETITYLEDGIPPKGSVTHKDFEEGNIKVCPSGKRSRIGVSRLYSRKNKYLKKSIFKTRELITVEDDISSIAIATEESIIDKNTEESITYYLVVNGKAIEIVPINSHKEGVKVIKDSKRSYKEDYSLFIDEEITSCYLYVEMTSLEETVSPVIKKINVLKN